MQLLIKSLDEATKGTIRKYQFREQKNYKPVLNFGGHNAELWCEGGESQLIACK
jgi:23S rRNA (adenine1618-N6)-methyltransferase